jgi:hypothetical protein
MAKLPPQRGKGEPPLADRILWNLDKPEPDGLVALNFKVPRAFRREFRLFAANQDKNMVEVLAEAFDLLKKLSMKNLSYHKPPDAAE